MTSPLETAEHPERLQRVVIEPLTRVEGHGKVTLLRDDRGHIHQARLHIAEFRGFEKFIQGRPYWELPVLVQRLCGICPVSHHLAAAKATDMLVGVDRLTPSAEKIRRLMHFGQTLQSHALHFFHLCAPDLLFGFDDLVRHRNIVGLIEDEPEIARQGVLLRRFGQEVIRATAGKRVHGTGALPGGVNQHLSPEDRDALLAEADQTVAWAEAAVSLVRRILSQHPDYHREFGLIDSNMLSLVGPDGGFELYQGRLRARAADGRTLLDQIDCRDYGQHLREAVKPWSYMKFPFLAALGPEAGWYRVGPLARVNNCEHFPTPLAEHGRRQFRSENGLLPVQSPLAYHWARMIELLHCAEAIRALLPDPDLVAGELRLQGSQQRRGIGVIEAPRGTLFHDYEIDRDGLVTRANLIVATTNNNQAMNESIRQVASHYLDGETLSEPLLNQIEVAIRAYDPCLSCATHALGQMPLEVELVDSAGRRLASRLRRGGGIRA